MYRARIALAAAALVAALAAVVAMHVGSTVTNASTAQIEALVGRAQATLPKLDLLRGIELTNETAKMAREDEFGEIFAKPEVNGQRQFAFVAVQARNARLEQQGRKADLLAVVGANGRVVSRDLNLDAMYDEDLKSKYPSVRAALDGVANKDVWTFDGHLYRVAAAPVRSKAGSVVGALVVGYVASAKEAASDRDKLGTEVAYFLDDKLQASSFKKESGGESAEEKDLAKQLFDGPKLAAGAEAEATRQFRIKIGAEEWVAAAGPLPGNMTKSSSGFLVLASVSQARAPFSELSNWVMLFGVAALLTAVGASILTATRFLGPLDRIETGVAEVINGNRDYQFDSPSQDFEGLANGLNVMMARLLGRPDPTDDETGEGASGQQRWQGELSVEDVTSTGPQASPENQALAAEPEEQYLQRVFSEYVAARRQNNEGTEGLEFPGFATKLRQNEAALMKKYSCRAVRFKVVVKSGQTTLKPVPIS